MKTTVVPISSRMSGSSSFQIVPAWKIVCIEATKYRAGMMWVNARSAMGMLEIS